MTKAVAHQFCIWTWVQALAFLAILIPFYDCVLAAIATVPVAGMFVIAIVTKPIVHQIRIRAAVVLRIQAGAVLAVGVIAAISSVPRTFWYVVGIIAKAVANCRCVWAFT